MLDKTVTDWQALAGQLDIEGRAFINGRYIDALSGGSRATSTPPTAANWRRWPYAVWKMPK